MISLDSKLKKKIIDKLAWNGNYNLVCNNCSSIIILDNPKEYNLVLNYLERKRIKALDVLRTYLHCCNKPEWFWKAKGMFKPHRFPPKIYYFDDIKEFFKL